MLKHDIQREFEISKFDILLVHNSWARFIVEKFAETEVFIDYFLCFNCFHPFLIKKKLMNIILTHDTRYGPVFLPFDF